VSLGPRVGLPCHFLCLVLPLFNDKVGQVAFNNALDVRQLMSGNDGEAGGVAADRLVLAQDHRDRLRTVGGAALADEVGGRLGLGLELFGELGDAFVDLAIERLVAGQTPLSFPHGGIVPIG
jgi:hypothetical protein